jgi:hypothetical protein
VASLTERMLGAARLDVRTYEEVEADESATGQAMLVVILVAIAAGIGAWSFGPRAVLVTLISTLVAWFVWAFLTYIIGTKLLPEPQTKANFGQLLRTIGFSASPGVLYVLGIIPFLGILITVAVWIWQLIAMVIGVRQALDYSSTGKAVVVCLIGFVAFVCVRFFFALLFLGGAMGLAGMGSGAPAY